MNKQQKLDRIYKVIADKTLSFGCILKTRLGGNVRYTGEKYYSNSMYGSYIKGNEEYNDHGIAIVIADGSQLIISAIIGHPVMIGDVLDWIDEKLFGDICENCEKCGKKLESVQHYYEAGGNIDDYDRLECEEHGEQDCLYTWEQYIIIMRKELRKPIEDQSDECIDFVYSLIG